MTGLIETLSTYVPALIAHRLAENPAPLSGPTTERFPAAVLFADISGFTPLAERLAKRGPAGAEELSGLLTAYFGKLIDVVNAHGGDIVKFAGDALVAVWHAPLRASSSERALRESVFLAAQCGLAVQTTLVEYQMRDESPLALRVGVGVGELATAHVGGMYKRWEFMIFGEPMLQASLAEHHAQPGQIVLSPESAAMLRDECVGETLPDGGLWLRSLRVPLDTSKLAPLKIPSLPPDSETALRSYIPGAILSRIAAGQTAWLAELRRVTVLFINLPDLNHRTPADQAQTIMRTLQTALYRYEGSINKLNVDDKGVMLVAALGLPPLSHGDDAARGVRAALDMQVMLDEIGVRSSIGIASGLTFCGSVGSERRREYTMIGDVVNLSARLMQAADGGVLCDAITYQSSENEINYETLEPITVKGKTEPVSVYRPRGVKMMIVRSQSEMVGRAAERKLLADELDMLHRGGDGGVIIIEGEAGIGKTRLLEDMMSHAQEIGLTWLLGTADAIESSTLYFTWRRVFTRLLDLDLFEDPAARRRHVLLTLGVERLRLAPLLKDVLQLDIAPTTLTNQMSPQARSEKTRELLQQLLQLSASRSPKLLILDDAQFMDSASVALALAVSQHVRPLLLVIATRPVTNPSPEYAQLLKSPQAKHIRLGALPLEDILTLVCRLLSVKSLPEPVSALINERAEGQPFFSQELVYALRDSGFIKIENGECVIAPDAGDLRGVDLPNTVQGAVTSRIDRLAPSQQLTLKVASVIGRVFPFRVLRDIHPIESNKSGLVDDLNTLETLDLTPLESTEPELAYLFKHIITQEVAYNLMLFSQRRELHRAAAEWYERAQANNLIPFYPILAHHWGKAEIVEKSLHYLSEAGQHALRLGASREAQTFLDQALSLTAHEGTTMSLEVRRYKAILNIQMAEVHRRLGEYSLARALIEESAAIARELNLREVLSESLMRLGRVETDVSENAAALQHLNEALTLARDLGDRKLIAEALYNLGILAMGRNDYREAIIRSEESARIFRKMGDVYGETGCINALGYGYWCLGDYQSAELKYLAALKNAREMGNPYMVTIVLDNLGFAQLMLNKDEEARQSFLESISGTVETRSVNVALEVIVGMATLIMRAGQEDEAMELVQFALHHPAASVDVKRLAQPPLDQLLKVMPPTAVEAASARGRALDLESVVEKIKQWGSQS